MKYVKQLFLWMTAAVMLAVSVGAVEAREPENFQRIFYKTGTIPSRGGNFGGSFRPSVNGAALYYRCASQRDGEIILGTESRPPIVKSYPAQCDNKIHRLSVPVRADSDMLVSMILRQQGTGALSVWALK